MAKAVPDKILRVGIIQSGKIIEERLLRHRQAVTIGESAKNTFVIPVSNLSRTTLFSVKGTQYSLTFKEGMDGRVSLDSGVMDFAALKSSGTAKRRGDTWAVPLTDKARGKVVVGDVTLLFQFVTPPPPAPKLQLPAAARGGWVKAIEWHFVSLIMISAFLQGGTIMFMVMQDWPEPKRGAGGIPDQFVSLIVPHKEADEPEPPPEEKKAKDEKPDEGETEKVKKKPDKVAKAAPKKKMSPEQQARANAAHKRKLAEKVRSKSLLKVLGALGPGGGSLVDSLAGGASRSRIDDAFAGTSGIVAASSGQDRSRRGGAAGDKGGRTVGIGDLKAARKGTVKGTAKKGKERSVRGAVKTTGPSSAIGLGKLDRGAVVRTVKSRIRAVQNCYERELKKNPNLGGKITVQFTIGGAGRVTAAKATVNTMGSPTVASCIVGRIRRWRFPKPEGGDVTFAYPFIFTAAK